MIKVTPFTNTRFTIPAKQEVPYLYNHLTKLVKKEQTGGIFHADRVEISASLKTQEENIINKLTELGAKFTMENKF